MSSLTASTGAIRSVSAALRTLGGQGPVEVPARSSGLPFITITRQAGAGGRSLADRLVERFNETVGDPPWRVYDRELIERVATDHGLPRWVIEGVAERTHSWLEDMASGLVFESPRPPDESVYRKVIATIRGLARTGHAVLIGRGAAFCTQDLPGGVHIQLVGPYEDRVRHVAAERGMSLKEADRWVRQTEAQREAFYRKYWAERARSLERFTLVINTSRIDLPTQVSLVGDLLGVHS